MAQNNTSKNGNSNNLGDQLGFEADLFKAADKHITLNFI